MRKRCNNTSDLFETKAVYPVRRPAVVETMSFDGTLKRAISQALSSPLLETSADDVMMKKDEEISPTGKKEAGSENSEEDDIVVA